MSAILQSTLAELRELFDIDLAAEPVWIQARPRDHREWTTDDSDLLVILRDAKATLVFASMLLGHRIETIRRWDAYLRPACRA